MSKNVKFSVTRVPNDKEYPLGIFIPEIGKCRLHLAEIFRLLDTMNSLYYYCSEDDYIEYENTTCNFTPIKTLNSPTFDYEYGRGRYEVIIGRVNSKQSLLLKTENSCELYIVNESRRRIIVDEDTLFLDELGNFVSVDSSESLSLRYMIDYIDLEEDEELVTFQEYI